MNLLEVAIRSRSLADPIEDIEARLAALETGATSSATDRRPVMRKLAIGIGGSYGRGVMTCRKGEHYTGPWSAPSMMALE